MAPQRVTGAVLARDLIHALAATTCLLAAKCMTSVANAVGWMGVLTVKVLRMVSKDSTDAVYAEDLGDWIDAVCAKAQTLALAVTTFQGLVHLPRLTGVENAVALMLA